MSEAYRWRFEDTSGQPLPSEHSVPFPTQADAEAWFAESWEDLADAGVKINYVMPGEFRGTGLTMAFPPTMVLMVSAMLVLIALGSGFLSLGVLKKSQPADLLR